MITTRSAHVLVGLLVGLVSVLPGVASADDAALTIDGVSDAEYPIVEVTVTVPSEIGMERLTKESFTVRENGRSVQPYLGTTPEAEEPTPPEIALAIDVSGSMDDSIDQARQAAINFVSSLPEDSQVAVVTFGDEARTLMQPTSNLLAVRTKIDDIRADDDNTALYDGVRTAANLLSAGGAEQPNVVLLSDGENNTGAGADAAIEALKSHGVRLWAVSLQNDDNLPALEALVGDNGRVLTASDGDSLDAIYAGVASDLARTYVLRYDSKTSGRTELSVSLDTGSLRSEQTIVTNIDDRGFAGKDELPPVTAVDSASEVVEVPLLGTVGAYLTGLTALAVGVLLLLLIIMTPRRPRTRERLVIGQPTNHRQMAKLTSIAHWTTEVTDRRLRRGRLGDRLDRALEGAGVNLRPGELVIVVASMMIVAYAVGVVTVNAILGVLLVPIPPLLVRLWLAVRRDRRQAAFSDQLTDVLQLIGSSLRAGYGLTQGIDAVSRDAEEPAAGEFRRIIIEHRLGRDLTEAMENCATRMDNADFSWVVQAISIHHDVGGDLSKVLDNIVATIRDRADVHRQVRTLSAEGRMSARVLTGLPIVVLLGLISFSPSYMSPMTSSPIGIVLLAFAGLLLIIGVLAMRKMSRIQY
jgi:tight adherence protein B